jgi:hypothetical protein
MTTHCGGPPGLGAEVVRHRELLAPVAVVDVDELGRGVRGGQRAIGRQRFSTARGRAATILPGGGD